MTKPYFHELSQKEVNELVESKKSWQYIIDNYEQPEWCEYPQALAGIMGCWSLADVTESGNRSKISRDYCKDCDCNKLNEKECF